MPSAERRSLPGGQPRPASGVVGSLLRDTSRLWGAEGAALGAFLVQGVLVARWLGPGRLGVAALAVGYPALLLGFLDTRAADTTIKFLGEFHGRGRTREALAVCHLGYVADASAAAVTLGLVAVTAGWAARHVVHSPQAATLLIVFAAAQVARAPAGTSKSVLATFGRFPELAAAKSINAFFQAALTIGLVAHGLGVAGVVWGSGVALLADSCLTTVLARRLSRRHWEPGTIRQSWAALAGRRREIVAFMAWADLGGTFSMLAKQGDIVILGWFWGPAIVGYYSLGESVASFAGSIVTPLQSAIYPRLALHHGVGDGDGLWDLVGSLARWVGLPLAAAGLVSMPLVPIGIRMTVGPSYLGAVVPARLLIGVGLVWLALFWVRPLLLTLGDVRWLAVLTGVTGVLAVGAMLALAPHFGAAGVAWAQLAVFTGTQAACLHRIAGARPPVRSAAVLA